MNNEWHVGHPVHFTSKLIFLLTPLMELIKIITLISSPPNSIHMLKSLTWWVWQGEQSDRVFWREDPPVPAPAPASWPPACRGRKRHPPPPPAFHLVQRWRPLPAAVALPRRWFAAQTWSTVEDRTEIYLIIWDANLVPIEVNGLIKSCKTCCENINWDLYLISH